MEEIPAEVADEESLGEWLHGELIASYGLETEEWARERVERVTERLHVLRTAGRQLRSEILWMQTMSAFTAPGGYLYVTRELLQRAASDEPVAFIVAHEMAHHDLGHARIFHGWLSRLRHLPSRLVAAALLHGAGRWLMGPERELAADSYALDLCVASGYDGEKCLELFDILEAYTLDHRDLDMVYGPDAAFAPGDSRTVEWLAQARTWGWQHARGYPCIRERKALLQAHLEALGAPQ